MDISLEDDEVSIFVAIGNLNGRKEANYHYGERTGAEGIINFDDNQLFFVLKISKPRKK